MKNRLISLSRRPAAAIPAIGAALILGGPASAQCISTGITGAVDTNNAQDVAVSGLNVWIADFDAPLKYVDVSDPSNPMLSTPIMDTSDGVAARFLTAYASGIVDGVRGVYAIDYTIFGSPMILDSIPLSGTSKGVEVSGDRLYVLDDSDFKLLVIDVTDPSNMTTLGTVDLPNLPVELDVAGNKVYIADQDGLQIVDVSDPASPVLQGAIVTPGTARDVDVSGTTAFIADSDALRFVDVSDPANPSIVGSIATSGAAFGVDVPGSTAFVATVGEGLEVYDVKDLASPMLIGSQATPAGLAGAVAVPRSIAYVADGTSGLQIIEVGGCDTGACCFNGGCVEEMRTEECITGGGIYLGNQSNCIFSFCPPVNDNCADATRILGGGTAFDTTRSTTDGPDLPKECDEGNGLDYGSDIWYRYTPTATGTLTVSTCNEANYDTRLAAYTDTCGSLDLIACNDDGNGCAGFTSVMDVPVTSGESILVRVGGFESDQGSGTLMLSQTGCPSDISGNGDVDFLDILRILADWGPCPQ